MRLSLPQRLARIIIVGIALIWGAAMARAATGEIATFTLTNPGNSHSVMLWQGQTSPNATAITAGTNGQVLVAGTSADPVFATIGTTTGISTTTGSGTLTINNTGVTSIVAGTGIGISGGTGAVTVSVTASSGTYTLVTKTTSYSVLAADAGSLFSDTGASGTVIYTLPAATGTGHVFGFRSDAAQITEVLAGTGDKIRFGGQQSGAAGNIQTTTGGRGNCVFIVDFATNDWTVINATGATWSVN